MRAITQANTSTTNRSAATRKTPLSVLSATVELRASAHVQSKVALKQVRCNWRPVGGLEIRRDDMVGRKRELPVTTWPKHQQYREAEEYEAADRDPSRSADDMS